MKRESKFKKGLYLVLVLVVTVAIYFGVSFALDNFGNNPTKDVIDSNSSSTNPIVSVIDNTLFETADAATTYPTKWYSWKKFDSNAKMTKAAEATVKAAVIADSKKYYQTRITVQTYKDSARKQVLRSATHWSTGHPGLLYGF